MRVGCAFETVSKTWLTEGTFGGGQGGLASYIVGNYWRHEERHTTGSGRYSGGRICRSEAVWDQEGVWPGGGDRLTALSPFVLRLGSVTSGWRRGGRGGGSGANRLQVGVQSALRCAGLCWLGRCWGGGGIFSAVVDPRL